MRKFVTAAAAAMALTLGVASPAFADQNYPYQGGQNQGQNNQGQYGDDDYRYPQDRRVEPRYNDNYNFDRQNGNFDRWERGWGDQYNDNRYRYQKPLSHKKLVRALAYQGYYGVRNLQKSRWGSDYRAFAFNRAGRPVMLRVNAFTGIVRDVRYL